MTELQSYPAVKPPEPTTVEKSVSREGAFSKPGHTAHVAKGKGWSPAKGTRFRATNEKPRGRQRKRRSDPRNVTFY